MLSLWYITMYALLSAGIGKVNMKIGKKSISAIKLCNRKRSLQIMIMTTPPFFFRSRYPSSRHKRKGIAYTNSVFNHSRPRQLITERMEIMAYFRRRDFEQNRQAFDFRFHATLARNNPMNNSAFETSRPHPRRRLQKRESSA